MFKPIEQLIRQIAAKEENISKTRKNALAYLADTLVIDREVLFFKSIFTLVRKNQIDLIFQLLYRCSN